MKCSLPYTLKIRKSNYRRVQRRIQLKDQKCEQKRKTEQIPVSCIAEVTFFLHVHPQLKVVFLKGRADERSSAQPVVSKNPVCMIQILFCRIDSEGIGYGLLEVSYS